MTTLLPPNDLAFFRAIAKTAAVLLVCLRIDELHPGRAIADFEIADILEQDPRTVVKQLRSLSASGLMLEQREDKYVVTPLGKNTLFAYREQSLLSMRTPEISSGSPDFCAQNVLHDMNDDAKNVENNESSIINQDERKLCAKYLENSHLLFNGSAVSTKDILDSDPQYVLAWLAKGYNDRNNSQLRNPPGMVYSKLKNKERPAVSRLKNPTQGLPEEYLRAVGLFEEPIIADTEDDVDDQQDLQKLADATVADDTVNVPMNDGKGMSALQAWQSVLSQLQLEMSRPAFDNWVQDTQALHFENNELMIKARNSYACKWLEDRITMTAQRILIGLVGCEITVKFVEGM